MAICSICRGPHNVLDCPRAKTTPGIDYFTDFGDELLLRNEQTGDIIVVGRYAAWRDGEVIRTASSLAELQHEYGTRPIYELKFPGEEKNG